MFTNTYMDYSVSNGKEKKFPAIKEKNQGKFTKWAMKNGFKDACSAAAAVVKSPKNIRLLL